MPNNNPIALANLYPRAQGVTTSQAGSAMTPSSTGDMSRPSGDVTLVENALQIGLLGEPVKFWILLAVIAFGGMWIANHFKGNAVFGNIRFSLYNIIAIVVLSIVGGSIAKVIFTRFPIPGISTIVLAS
ncbi:MAG TPA: hypothetical protein VGO47_14785 [Chlamydiales bacterium]|nr:hypothetical protein [Chlamydiales bacterium]